MDKNRINIASINGNLITFIGKDGNIFAEVHDDHAEYLPKGDELYVRVKISNSLGQIAWTQPMFLGS